MNCRTTWLLVACAALTWTETGSAQDVVIRITGNGPAAKYIEEGKTAQEDVEVTVGETVRWINEGNMRHSATSTLNDAADDPLFDTGEFTQMPPNNVRDVILDEALYTAAGGVPGGQVELEYFCTRHPAQMRSRILLKSAAIVRAPLMVRKNIASLSNAELASLRQGVAVMKSRDPNDPTSWEFQANIHWVPAGGPNHPLFRKCEHGTPHFLTWHRGYLYFFERILRDAAGDPGLTLPYWNWTNERAVPPSFRNADGGMNSLFHERAMNDGSSLPLSVVQASLDFALSQSSFGLFSQRLENPHGSVHVLVGGGGDMSSISTSARDPIFWLHHGNVDRNWDHWLINGHANPTDATFLARTFTFVDETGEEVTVTVEEILESAGLGYCYDDVPVPTPMPDPEVAAVEAPTHPHPEQNRAAHPEHAATHGGVVASSQPVDAPESAAGIKLAFEAKSLDLEFRTGGAESLESAAHAESAVSGRVVLEVVGVAAAAPPAFVYGVYVNLPEDGADAEQLAEHYVGSIDLFGVSEHGEEHHASPQQFDLTRKLEALGLSGEGATGDIRVTIRPLTPEPAKGQEPEEERYRASAEQAEVQFQRIDVRIISADGPEAAHLEHAVPERALISKRVALPLPPRDEPESAVDGVDGGTASDSDAALDALLARRLDLARELGRIDAEIARSLETICGSTTDFQDVERYDGMLGVPVDLVRDHERAVGQLQWLNDLADRFDGPDDSPGNVNGQRWGSGGMISADLFLTAGHCFDSDGGGWDMPFRNNVVIAPAEIAQLMKVNFLYQIDASTGLRRRAESFPVLELLEYRVGGLDFAIVRLGPNPEGELPGDKYGVLTVAAEDLAEPNAMLCLIQHPNGLPKKIEAGPMFTNAGGQITYNTLDSLGGSSGSPVLSLDGEIVGVHTNGGCTEFGGANRGVAIGAIRSVSALVPGGAEHAALGGH